jgi:radical SAM-linked protein
VATQRIRVYFAKGERVRFISHLDVLRYWERAIRRAELPLSYSQGFTPHPKLQFAGPLPLGYLSLREVVDVSLDERVDTAEFERKLSAQTVPDLQLIAVEEVPLSAPSPQNSLLWGDYLVDVPGLDPEDARTKAAAFMALRELPWTEERREKQRTFDLRAMTPSLSAAAIPFGTRLTMRLSATGEMMGRPEQILAAVFGGAEPATITRAGLVFEAVSPAHEAWRRKGRFQE